MTISISAEQLAEDYFVDLKPESETESEANLTDEYETDGEDGISDGSSEGGEQGSIAEEAEKPSRKNARRRREELYDSNDSFIDDDDLPEVASDGCEADGSLLQRLLMRSSNDPLPDGEEKDNRFLEEKHEQKAHRRDFFVWKGILPEDYGTKGHGIPLLLAEELKPKKRAPKPKDNSEKGSPKKKRESEKKTKLADIIEEKFGSDARDGEAVDADKAKKVEVPKKKVKKAKLSSETDMTAKPASDDEVNSPIVAMPTETSLESSSRSTPKKIVKMDYGTPLAEVEVRLAKQKLYDLVPQVELVDPKRFPSVLRLPFSELLVAMLRKNINSVAPTELLEDAFFKEVSTVLPFEAQDLEKLVKSKLLMYHRTQLLEFAIPRLRGELRNSMAAHNSGAVVNGTSETEASEPSVAEPSQKEDGSVRVKWTAEDRKLLYQMITSEVDALIIDYYLKALAGESLAPFNETMARQPIYARLQELLKPAVPLSVLTGSDIGKEFTGYKRKLEKIKASELGVVPRCVPAKREKTPSPSTEEVKIVLKTDAIEASESRLTIADILNVTS